MKYYHLTTSSILEDVGKVPQAPTVAKIGTIGREYQLGINEAVPSSIELPEPILEGDALATTIINVVPINSLVFLVVKKSFIDFLNNFKIGEFNYWKIKVHQKNNIINDYCLFHLSIPDQIRYIDFNNSEFFIGKDGDWRFKGDKLKVSDYNNYINLKEVLSNDGLTIKSNKLIFNLSDVEHDMFRITNCPFGNGYFVSERLANAIKKEKFTGFDFQDINTIHGNIEVWESVDNTNT